MNHYKEYTYHPEISSRAVLCSIIEFSCQHSLSVPIEPVRISDRFDGAMQKKSRQL